MPYAFIYALTSRHTESVYIGSTVHSLNDRLSRHKSDYRRYKNGSRPGYISSYEICKLRDVEITALRSIELEEIEENPECITEAEREIILLFKENAVNNRVEGASKAAGGRAAYVKAWHQRNAQRVKEIKAKHYEKVKQKIKCVCGGEYMIKHKQQHLVSLKHVNGINPNYRPETAEERKNKYNARKHERIYCPRCQIELCRGALSRHMRTQHT